MSRSRISGVLAGLVGLVAATQVGAQQVCAPTLIVKQARLADLRAPAVARLWSAVVSVDASACVAEAGGHFDVVFSRLKENAPELEFREQFAWSPPSASVAVDFAADEAVERYRVEGVTPCRCPGQQAEVMQR